MRTRLKRLLSLAAARRPGAGVTLLTYHRVSGASRDELDLSPESFAAQLDALDGHEVVALDVAASRLATGDSRPSVVLTFDDGFADLYAAAWPLLRARELPFTLYLAAGFVGATMSWPGSTATAGPAAALSWRQLTELVDSGLCAVGNHTHTHVRPERLSVAELDRCSEAIERHLGVRPAHFAYPWGIPVPALEPELRQRFRTAATGRVGRNMPGDDLHRLYRVPVRRTDPIEFFRAKLAGSLVPERTYAGIVATAKAVGLHA